MKKVLYTGGTFDLFHAGHVNFLRMCKTLTDEVVVSLNTDEFIQEYKGFSPIYSFEQRREILQSCRHVDRVIANFGGKDSTRAIKMISPQIIAIGTDWAAKNYYSQMGFTQSWLDSKGITLVYLPYTDGVSSTYVKQKIAENIRQ